MIPETLEDIAATALARWLSARDEAGRLPPPPIDLDPDVVEAVYALRPDFAPSPTMVLEDIWQTLDEAPRLQRWLDGGSSEGIDPQVREAVYAMSPGRAPAATVTFEEIVAALQGGPKLARFLDDRGGEVDDDVREAVYALRPDLAPAPRVTIEDILSTVKGAPRLARFLDESDDDRVDSVDDDVLEAVYAFKPGLAPGPKVQMDDIFARIQSGPFAKKTEPARQFTEAPGQEPEIANTPMRPAEDSVVARDRQVANQPIRRRRGWIAAFLLAGGGGVAVFASAAAVLMLVVIAGGTAGNSPPPMAPEAAEVSSAPSPVVAERPNGGALANKEAPTDRIAEAEPVPEARQTELAPPRPAETVAARDEFNGKAKGDSVNYGVVPSTEGGGLGGAPMMGPAPKSPAPVPDAAPKVARVEDVDDAPQAAAKAASDAPSSARTAAVTRKVTAPDPSKEDGFVKSQISYAEREAPLSMKVRDWRQAGDAYKRVVDEKTASAGIAHWYAAKAGEQYLQAGDASAALAVTDQAIAKGKSPQLPAALRVKGDALAALGRSAEAEAAYKAAAK